jgi:hypothetical protein
MGNNKSKYITIANIDNWASSLGFSFPRNRSEEVLFDKLYSQFDYELTGDVIDPFKLIEEVEMEESQEQSADSSSNWKMAARNYGELPDHIIDKMKKNHNDKT